MVALGWEVAGFCGVDPRPYTLRKLFRMAAGKWKFGLSQMGQLFAEEPSPNPFEIPEPLTAAERQAIKDQVFRTAMNALRTMTGG